MSDFERVRKNLERGKLYEDPEFPAVQNTVFYHQTPPFQFSWKRPHVSVSQLCKIHLEKMYACDADGSLLTVVRAARKERPHHELSQMGPYVT